MIGKVIKKDIKKNIKLQEIEVRKIMLEPDPLGVGEDVPEDEYDDLVYNIKGILDRKDDNLDDKKELLIYNYHLFSWFWTEDFGIAPKYAYGKTIERALNFWHERELSNTGLSRVISIVDIKQNEKLVFYESNTNTLWCGLVKRKWNNKWIVIEQGGGVPLFVQNGIDEKDGLNWKWHNMKEFGLTMGVINNLNISKIIVGGKNAVILNDDNKNIWYFIDKTGSSYLNYKPNLDIKAFGKTGDLVYSYYPQK